MEGDAVHRAAARLSTLAGATVTHAEFRNHLATASLRGTTLDATKAHGKHLLTRLADGRTLHSHLRMDGSWTIVRKHRDDGRPALPRHLLPQLRAVLTLDDGRSLVGLGVPVMDLLATRDEHRVVGHLGPDVLAGQPTATQEHFDLDEALARLGKEPGRPVVETLLDQRGVAGFGNLWAVELCFLRGPWPWTPVGEVPLEPLLALGQKMIRHSLEHGTGMTTTGVKRRGQNHWVTGRSNRPCYRCGTLIRFRPATGASYAREVWWCPSCQPRQDGRRGEPAGTADRRP
ncbi:DNA-formamidopyrimidine glycosylase family protein [Actinomycetospora termitidis]|uniref:DNA-(apurinic or apyrimidinic site) lyase n=1 Tax=Actinomycetospora termitidis TaxID=3053470 RepID=A0ABT7M307_9PSEU|nr:DNA-formamidopyrimidine glycosylase family protein [Actinomycetospora sp. Odt1-22]MDL5154574.1 DNA-formamidopyrimidine glycosylase family protein [Actinomycetospora sp. Odt1-22]